MLLKKAAVCCLASGSLVEGPALAGGLYVAGNTTSTAASA